jgi:hypothetical protein
MFVFYAGRHSSLKGHQMADFPPFKIHSTSFLFFAFFEIAAGWNLRFADFRSAGFPIIEYYGEFSAIINWGNQRGSYGN